MININNINNNNNKQVHTYKGWFCKFDDSICIDVCGPPLNNQNNCPINNQCENTLGDYQCIFNHNFQSHILKPRDTLTTCGGEGYQGINCSDIDECATDQYDCPELSTCNNTYGSYVCICNDGYGGINCSDIEECTTDQDNCTGHSTCNNTIGSYTCNCDDGYQGNDCIDIDECTTQNICPINSTCQNTYGSYTCNCDYGYEGND